MFTKISLKDEMFNSIFMKYLSLLKDSTTTPEDIMKMDGEIQVSIIEDYLQVSKEEDEDLQHEDLEWVKTYSTSFREYLNTVKLLAFLCNSHKKITSEERKTLIEETNDSLEFLNSIFS